MFLNVVVVPFDEDVQPSVDAVRNGILSSALFLESQLLLEFGTNVVPNWTDISPRSTKPGGERTTIGEWLRLVDKLIPSLVFGKVIFGIA